MALSGCQLVSGTERELIGYSQQGVAMLRQGITEKSAVIDQFHQLRRKQLDDAFDADVRDRQSLDAKWVIDARKAYAIGLDALREDQTQSLRATSSQLHTADSIKTALEKLQMLRDCADAMGFTWFGVNNGRCEMISKNDRLLVEAAVRQSWDDFATEHPHLARQLDQDRVMESATQALIDQPGFVEALGRADVVGGALSMLKDQVALVVRRMVGVVR